MDPSELVKRNLHGAVKYLYIVIRDIYLHLFVHVCFANARIYMQPLKRIKENSYRFWTMAIVCNTNLTPLHMSRDSLWYIQMRMSVNDMHNLIHIAAYIDCQPWWPDGRTWGKLWSASLRWTFPRFHGWLLRLHDWKCWSMLKSCESILLDAILPTISGYIDLSIIWTHACRNQSVSCFTSWEAKAFVWLVLLVGFSSNLPDFKEVPTKYMLTCQKKLDKVI